MSWTRGLLALLAVCVLLVTGPVSCGADGAQERRDGQSVSPVGKVLDDTDHEGRHYREVDQENAPDVGIVVQPDADDGWTVRLTVENFIFSSPGAPAKAVPGRGVAVLFVDDRPVTTLRTPSYRLAAEYVPQGTHKVTARLYADDGTVWAVDGAPVESTADVTASEPLAMGGTGGVVSAGTPRDARGTGGGGAASAWPTVGAATSSALRSPLVRRMGNDVMGRLSAGDGQGAAGEARSGGGTPPRTTARDTDGRPWTTRLASGIGGWPWTSRLARGTGDGVPAPQTGIGTGTTALGGRPVADDGPASVQADTVIGDAAGESGAGSGTGGWIPASQAEAVAGGARPGSRPVQAGAASGVAAQDPQLTSGTGGGVPASQAHPAAGSARPSHTNRTSHPRPSQAQTSPTPAPRSPQPHTSPTPRPQLTQTQISATPEPQQTQTRTSATPEPRPTRTHTGTTPETRPAAASAVVVSDVGSPARTWWQGSPDDGGKAS